MICVDLLRKIISNCKPLFSVKMVRRTTKIVYSLQYKTGLLNFDDLMWIDLILFKRNFVDLVGGYVMYDRKPLVRSTPR